MGRPAPSAEAEAGLAVRADPTRISQEFAFDPLAIRTFAPILRDNFRAPGLDVPPAAPRAQTTVPMVCEERVS